MTKQIVIIGFMGTGKSTVGRALATRINGVMSDLDELIAKNEGRSSAEIIEADGENHFRAVETQNLRSVLEDKTVGIVAVGGGAWTVAQNRQLIADQGAFTVWLDAPFALCWRRIENGGEVRPLAPSREVAEGLYEDRRSIYALADARITIDENDSAEAIASRVVQDFSRHGANRQNQAEKNAL